MIDKVTNYLDTAGLKWLKLLWDHGNLFEIGVLQATESFYTTKSKA